MRPMTYVEQPITGVLCTYPHQAVRTTNPCAAKADSSVTTPDGRVLFRCRSHQGKVDHKTTGRVRHTRLVAVPAPNHQ
jgi:hypothetical protein